MGKRKTYDDEFRAGAVLMLEAAGYPDTPGALAMVAGRLNMAESTLSRWARGTSNPPPSNIVSNKKQGLVEYIGEELVKLIQHMAEVRYDASYRDSAISFGVLVDKLQVLTNEPTENVQQTITFKREGISSLPESMRESPGADEDHN